MDEHIHVPNDIFYGLEEAFCLSYANDIHVPNDIFSGLDEAFYLFMQFFHIDLVLWPISQVMIL